MKRSDSSMPGYFAREEMLAVPGQPGSGWNLQRERRRDARQRVNGFLDAAVIERFKAKAGDLGYQTLIDEALKQAPQAGTIEGVVRKTIREALRRASVRSSTDMAVQELSQEHHQRQPLRPSIYLWRPSAMGDHRQWPTLATVPYRPKGDTRLRLPDSRQWGV